MSVRGLKKHVMSSAKGENFTSSFLILILWSWSFWRLLHAITSGLSMDKRGDKRSHISSPGQHWNSLLQNHNYAAKRIKDGLKLKVWRTFSGNSWSRESNAFLKSIVTMIPDCPLCSVYSNTSSIVLTASKIDLYLSRTYFCSNESSQVEYTLVVWLTPFKAILVSTVVREIGLCIVFCCCYCCRNSHKGKLVSSTH